MTLGAAFVIAAVLGAAVGAVDSQDKAYLLGYYLLDLVGDEFLADVLAKDRDDFAAPPPLKPAPNP